MPENPLKIYETLDPELLKMVTASRDLAFKDGALPVKVKLLIALAIDASLGSVDGVTALTGMAMKAGASKGEVAEALRVAAFISGAGGVYTAARALKDLA